MEFMWSAGGESAESEAGRGEKERNICQVSGTVVSHSDPLSGNEVIQHNHSFQLTIKIKSKSDIKRGEVLGQGVHLLGNMKC